MRNPTPHASLHMTRSLQQNEGQPGTAIFPERGSKQLRSGHPGDKCRLLKPAPLQARSAARTRGAEQSTLPINGMSLRKAKRCWALCMWLSKTQPVRLARRPGLWVEQTVHWFRAASPPPSTTFPDFPRLLWWPLHRVGAHVPCRMRQSESPRLEGLRGL